MYKVFRLLFLLISCSVNAQIHELGVFLGGSNYIGDVGRTTYIRPNEPAFGVLYKWNKSPRHSYRISYTQSKITANDLDSKDSGRNQRGYYFENNIKELSLDLEFNFFDFDLHAGRTKLTPYVYSGISYFKFDELSLISEEIVKTTDTSAFAIPMALGIKSNVTPSIVLALEVGARFTLTDNLDGSNPKDESLAKFGNINNNDWYVFSGITLTYTLGSKPCFCAE